MILKLICKYETLFFSYKKGIQCILLVCATYFIIQKPYLTAVTSSNLLFKKLTNPFEVAPMKYKDEFDLIVSPANTILILCDKKYSNFFDLLYGSVKNIKIYYRDIIFTTNDKKLTSKYFTVIYLTFGDENFTQIFPLRNTQPNSDLASISNFYFPNKYHASIRDLIYEPDLNFPFTLNIQIQYSRKYVKHFCTFLRALQNVDAFTSGKYFYIPFKNTHFDINQFALFCIFTFLFHLFDWIEEHQEGSIFTTGLNLLAFYFLPITSIYCIRLKREQIFLALCYFFIHFRYGILLFLYLYLCALRKITQNYLQKSTKRK